MELIDTEVSKDIAVEVPKQEIFNPWYLSPVILEDGTTDYPEFRELQKKRCLLIYQREF